MRKEVVISILVGLILGLIITYGFYIARSNSKIGQVTKKDDLETSSATGSGETSVGNLKISNPLDGSLTTNPQTQVKGQTTPNGFVVTSLLGQIMVTTADDQGAFTQDMTLKPGGNILIIQATDENGQLSTVTRTVILEDQSLTASGSAIVATPTPGPSLTPTPTSKAKPGTKPTATPTPKPMSKPTPTAKP